ncbi:hypothetical protein VNI00_011734, partial [Paramarasmius palmivorus]
MTAFQPLNFGSLTMRNRIVISALMRDSAVPTNVPNSTTGNTRESAGLITSEGILMMQQGCEWESEYAPGIWKKEHVQGRRQITTAVHDAGSLIYAQVPLASLSYRTKDSRLPASRSFSRASCVRAGNVARTIYQDTFDINVVARVSARGGKFRFLPGSPTYAMPEPSEIGNPQGIMASFKTGAIRPLEAGFDGVEWVMQSSNYAQALDSTSNKRIDQWGGSIENRCIFALEVLEVLIEIWRADRVAIKINPTGGYNDVGSVATVVY